MPKQACPATALAEPSPKHGLATARNRDQQAARFFFRPEHRHTPRSHPPRQQPICSWAPFIDRQSSPVGQRAQVSPRRTARRWMVRKGLSARSERHPASLPLTSEVRRRLTLKERPTRKGVALPHVLRRHQASHPRSHCGRGKPAPCMRGRRDAR